MLTAFKWLQKGSKMKNFRLFQVFTLIAFLLRWIAFKQNYLEQDIILEHQYGHVETLFCLKRAQSQHVTLYNDFIFSSLTSFRLWLQKRGSVLSTRMYSSSAINIKPSDVIRK